MKERTFRSEGDLGTKAQSHKVMEELGLKSGEKFFLLFKPVVGLKSDDEI